MGKPFVRKKLVAKYGSFCQYCGTNVEIDTFHIEHMTPQIRGGRGGENYTVSCYRCNANKNDKNVEEYRLYLHSLVKDYLRKIEERLIISNKWNGDNETERISRGNKIEYHVRALTEILNETGVCFPLDQILRPANNIDAHKE